MFKPYGIIPALVTPLDERGQLKEDALRKVIDKVKYNGKNLYQEACRNRALLFFKKEDRFDEYIRLYKKLINKSWK